MVTAWRAVHPEKALTPMLVTLAGIDMLLSMVAPLKARSPIDVRPLGRATLWSELFHSNALSLMARTGRLMPPALRFAGMTRLDAVPL
jgi:hypothetical protein